MGNGSTLRRHVRYDLSLAVLVRAHAWSEPREMLTVDLSAGGLFLATEDVEATGTKLTVSLPIGKLEPLDLEGVVVRVVSPSADGRPGGLGLQFSNLDDANRARLEEVLSALRELSSEAGSGVTAREVAPPTEVFDIALEMDLDRRCRAALSDHDFATALTYAERLHRGRPNKRDYALMHSLAAGMTLRARDPESARAHFEEALALDPQCEEAALALRSMGKARKRRPASGTFWQRLLGRSAPAT